ncbi:hypothetical protein [Aquimarina sp. ERC-38]|uniref:hypothetical protein n=1 Tax=Aquimarina sp. ERC-38 TaxID=2949996 RepID=UPI003A5986DF
MWNTSKKRVFSTKKVRNSNSLVDLKNYSSGLYFNTIQNQNQKVQTFKVLKK